MVLKKNATSKKKSISKVNSDGNNVSKKKGKGTTTKKDGEQQVQKSPAEFFAENQAIAGFDNLGKSLYTSIRELIENGLDACESIDSLPDISIDITEYMQDEFNSRATTVMGLSSTIPSPIRNTTKKRPISKQSMSDKKGKKKLLSESDDEIGDDAANDDAVADVVNEPNKKASNKGNNPNSKAKKDQEGYFLIKVKDNGCGMDHNAIPNLFGRVLSGSKYGVRQTRGKFGLGAKMALIWAKKSTGQPIRITTAHRPTLASQSTIPDTISTCVLDIDIYKNEPRIIEHTSDDNSQQRMIGTEVQVLIAGNWTTYKSRIVQYLQQLAIITPYAELQLRYTNYSDCKRNMFIKYDRRSEQMPPTPTTVKHHPASVNNIIIQQLIQFTKSKTVVQFLHKELSSVSTTLAQRLISQLINANVDVTDDMSPKDLTDRHITRLVQLLQNTDIFKSPDGSCLSPLGEYNLNLGIHKVLEPELVATARDKACAYEGHPIVVEAAVCLGSKEIKEGVTVFRFANRIPLLFEGGSDVTTRVAMTKINWSSYKIDYKRDRVGVFVSIVSTKIPFKGTSKEYIGDDVIPIHTSVKRAIQLCCQQLRTHLLKRNALKDAQTRKSKLIKYVPDISRALYGLLDGMRKRKQDDDDQSSTNDTVSTSIFPLSPTKRLRLNNNTTIQMIEQLNTGQVSVDILDQSLRETIEKENPVTGTSANATIVAAEAAGLVAREKLAIPLYIIPLYNFDDPQHDIIHSSKLFTFRPLYPVEHKLVTKT
jgi:DNA topoisomerase VI subunit B